MWARTARNKEALGHSRIDQLRINIGKTIDLRLTRAVTQKGKI